MSDEDPRGERPADIRQDAVPATAALREKSKAEDHECEREYPPPFDAESLHETSEKTQKRDTVPVAYYRYKL
jgi:hypothetical protein